MFLIMKLTEVDEARQDKKDNAERQKIFNGMTSWEISYEDWQEALENILARTQTRYIQILDERQMRSYLMYKNSK